MSVSVKYKNFLQGISVLPKSASESALLGEIEALNTTNKLYFHNGTINDPIVQENVTATLANKTLTAPVINSATADTITGIAGGDLSLQSSVGFKVLVENINFDSNTISSAGDININNVTGQNTYFKVTGTDVVRIDADGIAFLSQNDAKFYDATTNFVNIQASNPTASYPITLPAAAPTANTALVYDGTAYKWGAAGGADSAGANDDILATAFRARILDSFDDAPSAPPTGASTINSLTTTATHVPANQLYAIQYDGTQTLAGGGINYSLGASPSFTLAVGDVLVAGGEVRKITALGTPNAWVSFTIESAFVGSPSGPCVVSQTVSSKELYGSVFDGDSISDAFSNASFSEYLIDYQDSTTAIYQTGTSPLVGYSVSQDNSTWSNPADRPQYQTDEIQSGTFASPGTALYVRLFANANTLASSGTINLLEYRAYMQKSPIVASGILNQAYARLDGSLLQDCTLATVLGKTQVTLDWPYSNGVNTPAAFGTIDVYINGQFIPRQNSAGTLLTSGAFYKEISSTVIELDTDYSTTAYAVQIIQRQPIGNFTSSTGSSSSAVGSGLKNYLTTYKGNAGNGDFETGDTTGWGKFNTTLTGVIPTGSISSGAGSITTFQATSTTPLAATYSLSVGGSISAGQGFISDAFTIDLEDQAKVLTFSFAYQAVSGTMNFSGTSSNTWAVYIYDATVGTWIQPAGVYNLVQSSGAGLATGTFQTTSSSTSYRIAVICINATGGAVSMRFDDFFVGPQISVTAPAVSDWQDAGTTTYTTPSTKTSTGRFDGTWVTNTSYSGKFRRVGDSLQVQVYITLTGAPTTSPLRINIPSGLSIDTTKIANTTAMPIFGTGETAKSGTYYALRVLYFNSTTVELTYQSALNAVESGVAQNAPVTYASGDTVMATFQVPIAGWSSNTVASADTDTRVVAAIASHSIQSIANNSDVQLTGFTVTTDTHGAFSSNQYNIPVSGVYSISQYGFFANNGTGTRRLSYRIDGGAWVYIDERFGNASINMYVGNTVLLTLNAGQNIQFGVFQNSGGALNYTGVRFSINRLSGPAVVQASETVAASYYASASGTSTTTSPINFDTKEYDTHNAVTASPPGSGAWRYTAPVSGTYLVTIYVNASAGTASYFNIYKNSTTTNYKTIGYAATATIGNGSTSLKLNAGDFIGIYTSASYPYLGNASLGSQNTAHISITRTGN
jgi:hypothetical protein